MRWLIVFLGCSFVQATFFPVLAGGSERVAIGRVDAIYPDERRIVVDDRNFRFAENTIVYDYGGAKAGIMVIQVGDHVRLVYGTENHNTGLLKKIQRLSEYEAERFIESQRRNLE